MLTMEAFLGNLTFLQGIPAVFLVALTAALLLFLQDWRGLVAVLAVQFVAAGVLFAWILEPNMAGVKLIVGLFVCLMLYFTGRQVGWDSNLVDINTAQENNRLVTIGPITLPSDRLVRSALALLVGAVALLFLPRSGNVSMSVALELAAYIFVTLGLVTVGVYERPYKAGMGLLTFLTGFDLLYSALAFSKTLLVFFTVAQLATVLVVTYQMQRRYFSHLHDKL